MRSFLLKKTSAPYRKAETNVSQNHLPREENSAAVANGITVMMELFTGLAFIVVLALSMTMFGCGKEEVRSPVTSVSMTTDAPTSTPVVKPVERTESEIVVEEELPVSFADAEAVYNQRNYDEATALFSKYVQQNADNAWGHYMLGLSSKRSGDLYQAEVAFSRALELDPKHVKSLLNLSRVLIDDLRPQEALDELDRALELDAESSVAYRLQGRAFHNLGWSDDAIHAYKEAILIDSTDAWSMNNLALVQLEQERYEEALTALSRTIELRDDVAIFFNNLGMALEHTGHVRDAQEAYASAIELDGTYDKASKNLARVEGIEQDSTIAPVDFEMLARVFIEEIRSWNEEALAAENANLIELDEAVKLINESDSTVVIDFEEF